MTDPIRPTIPRRLVYRIVAACCRDQAAVVSHRNPASSAHRRNRAAGIAAAGRQPDRQEHAAELRDFAHELTGWMNAPARCHGSEVEAELVGLVCALAFGRSEAWPDLKARANGCLDDTDWRDIPDVLERLLD